jgi:carboxyl-terminal processing protease
MNKKIVVLAVALGFMAGFFINNTGFAQKNQDQDALYKELELFSDAVSIIRSDYVEQPNSKDLIYGAMKGMLSSLDPYSQFMDPDTYNEMKIETEGRFGGIGIEITVKDNLLTVIAPIDDTPSYKVGLKSGDKIVKIDGEITKDLTLIEAVKRLRGKPGTDVNVTILRETEKKLLDFTITRDIIKIESIRKSEFVEQGIGYIRISEFQEKTGADLEKSVKELEKNDLKGLILDLRNNPGGLLDAAVEVSGKFLEKGKTVVSIKGRVEGQNYVFKSKNKNEHLRYPMVILINGGSASASEIVAGAVQDHKRGVIMGTKSFGKGSVQTVMPLSQGSALRLTTSKYFTPAERSIHGEGIMPDILVEYKEKPAEDEKEDESDIFETLLDKKEDTEQKEIKEKRKQYDNQILSAADVLKGIIIYSEK